MTLAGPTGAKRDVVCECGVTVTEHELRLYPQPEGAPPTHWSRDHHRAPCGLQCAAGGIRGEGALNDGTFMPVREVLKRGAFHGALGRWRGKCSCKEAPRG